MIHKENIKAASATKGHLPPQSVNAAATGAPSTAGWVAGTSLLGRRLVGLCQTGAFVGTTPSCAFKLQVADDTNGTSAADVTNGAIATIATANTVSQGELDISLIDVTKFYAIACTVTGGTSAIVGAQLRLLDPAYPA